MKHPRPVVGRKSSALALSLACLVCTETGAFFSPGAFSNRHLGGTASAARASALGLSSTSRNGLPVVNSAARARVGGASLKMAEGDTSTVAETAEEKAAKLRKLAADLRAQAEELEAARDTERQAAAKQAFDSFDKNDDGNVDVNELITGLEGQLKIDFKKRLAKKLGRKPTNAEVEDKISGMPGGVLLPEDIGQKLIEIYDKNGDGVLQASEFAPEGDIRLRLEGLFTERAQEARAAAASAREKEIEERGALKARDAARAAGLPSPEDFNNAPPTVADKALSALPYVLPLMDSLVFGAHIFQAFPTQLAPLEPLVAFLLIYRSLPFSGLFLFFGLQWFAGKPEVNKLVRYNCRQAVNIDIAMFFPSLLAFLVNLSLGNDAAKLAPVAQAGSDVIFVTVVLAVLYSIVSSAFGVQPENLPIISKFNRERMKTDDDDITRR